MMINIDEYLNPVGVNTFQEDYLGFVLKTGDKVKIQGCKSSEGFIGYDVMNNKKFQIYFEFENQITAWNLHPAVIKNHKIKKLN